MSTEQESKEEKIIISQGFSEKESGHQGMQKTLQSSISEGQ